MAHSKHSLALAFLGHLLQLMHCFFGAFHRLRHRLLMVKSKPTLFSYRLTVRNHDLWEQLFDLSPGQAWEDLVTLVNAASLMNVEHQLRGDLLLVSDQSVFRRQDRSLVR